MTHPMNKNPIYPIGTFGSYDEAESKLDKENFWITPDFRAYDKMVISGMGCWLEMDAETLIALYELQTNIEFFADKVETPFTKLVSDAQEFEATFKKCLEAIKYKPLKQQKF